MNAPIESLRKELIAPRSNYDLAQEILVVLWRRKFMILAVAFAAAVLGAGVTRLMQPRYTSSAVIQVDLGGHDVTQLNVRGDTVANTAPSISVDGKVYVESYARLIQAPEVVRQVVLRLGLDKVQVEPSFLHAVLSKIAKTIFFGSSTKPSPVDLATKRLLDDLTVGTDTKSYLITVTYTANTPEDAAHIANALVSEALHMQFVRTLADRHTVAQRALTDLSATYGPKHPAFERTKAYLAESEALDKAADLQSAPMSESELAGTGHVVPARPFTIPTSPKRPIIIGFSFLLGLAGAIGFALLVERRNGRLKRDVV